MLTEETWNYYRPLEWIKINLNYLVTNVLIGTGKLYRLARVKPGNTGVGIVSGTVAAKLFQRWRQSLSQTPASLFFGGGVFLLMNTHLIVQQFSRKEWLLKPNSMLSKIQFYFLAVFARFKSHTYDMQDSLPPLPVPVLERTEEKFLGTVKHLLTSDEYKACVLELRAFVQSESGRLCQRTLQLYASTKRNWVKEFWEKYIYLADRRPLIFSSNWYGMDRLQVMEIRDPRPQIIRAASVVASFIQYEEMIRKGTLLKESEIPVCMDQYLRAFGSARIPQKNVDQIVVAISKHIVVYAGGNYFSLKCFHDDGRLLSYLELKQAFSLIIDSVSMEQNTSVPVQSAMNLLTCQRRDNWAEDHAVLMKEPTTAAFLKTMESALLVIVLDNKEFGLREKFRNEIARDALLGTYGRWFDKMNVIIYADGTLGANVEHTVSDASIQAAALQYSLAREEAAAVRDGDALIFRSLPSAPITAGFKPDIQRLECKLPEQIEKKIPQIQMSTQQETDDYDIFILEFREYGKEFPKRCKLSPDAWIQMAIQLAYYRLTGKHEMTYESASTRLFWGGRTETIRTGSKDSAAFVEAMQNSATDVDTSLKNAVKVHEEKKKAAMLGEGVDRHMFGLYLMARHLKDTSKLKEIPAFFNNKAANLPFVIATSQTPFKDGLGNGYGGGFSPLYDASGKKWPNACGISYSVKKDCIIFHITSFKSGNQGRFSSEELGNAIFQAMQDMHKLYPDDTKRARNKI